MTKRDLYFTFVGLVGGLIVVGVLRGLSAVEFIWTNTDEIRNLAIALAALIGFPLILWRASAADRSARAAEQGYITDRFSKAIEQLGNDKISIRVGGIYALERIARVSTRDHQTVMEILASYIRQEIRVPAETENRQSLQEKQSLVSIKDVPARRPDVQAALTVIGRRNPRHDDKNRLLVLDMTNLDGALLMNMNLSRIDFFRAVLTRAGLQRADLTNSNLRKALLSKARLNNSCLRSTDLRGVDLSEATGLTGNQISEAITDASTIMPFSS